MTDLVDIAEKILTATLPGSVMYDSGQTDFAVQDAGLACAGMPPAWYSAVCYRVLGDQKAYCDLWARLSAMALCSRHRAVRVRAGTIASLILAEDKSATIIEKIGLIPVLLDVSRSQYYRDVRESHLAYRARLDSWARSGLAHIVRRAR